MFQQPSLDTSVPPSCAVPHFGCRMDGRQEGLWDLGGVSVRKLAGWPGLGLISFLAISVVLGASRCSGNMSLLSWVKGR